MIPKIIHQIWIGDEMPEILKLYTSTWKEQGWEYKFWINSDLEEDNFPRTWKYIKKIQDKVPIVHAKIADLMRYEILFHYGGVYIDTNIERLKDISDLFVPQDKIVICNEIDEIKNSPFLSNSFIACERHYKVLDFLTSKSELEKINFLEKANKSTGPYYFRKGFKNFRNVKVIPKKLIFPYDVNSDEYDKCVRYSNARGYHQTKYFDSIYYIKFPCTCYSREPFMVKHWDIGGTWVKK